MVWHSAEVSGRSMARSTGGGPESTSNMKQGASAVAGLLSWIVAADVFIAFATETVSSAQG